MRDAEFAHEFSKMALNLEKFFRDKMRTPVPRGDKALLAEDLVQLTVMYALENSRKPEYKDYSIKVLLISKAHNIWAEYTDPPQKRFVPEALSILAEEKAGRINELDRLILSQEINDIEKMADEKTWAAVQLLNEGYENEEIALKLNLKEGTLRQRIHRLRKQIKFRWKDKGLL
jgi:DNA-directed RNA polymerase specialized sigma24 family protein